MLRFTIDDIVVAVYDPTSCDSKGMGMLKYRFVKNGIEFLNANFAISSLSSFVDILIQALQEEKKVSYELVDELKNISSYMDVGDLSFLIKKGTIKDEEGIMRTAFIEHVILYHKT